MQTYIEEFVKYLKKERNLSKNSLDAYSADITEFNSFVALKGVKDLKDVKKTEIVSFLLDIKNQGKSKATANRKIASLRAFYGYLQSIEEIKENPTTNIKSPKIERRAIEFLTIEEMVLLLSIPDKSCKGVRDKALLEIIYATGIRVSELVEANVEDINLRVGFITCTGEHGKARIVPIGKYGRAALDEYIFEARGKIIKESKEKALFVNYQGKRLTRQGLWKILKEYAKAANLEKKLTPQILRNSFAAHMIQNGADLKSLQELLGHEDLTATQIYLSVTKNRIKDVYDSTHPRA